MNHLQNVKALKNRYFVMRHGQSVANVQKIIISYPENGVHPDYALSELGRQQAIDSAKSSKLTTDTIIYSSDFSRAKETAEIVRKTIGASEVHWTEALRERHFGDLEKSDSANYHKVWESDVASPDHNENNVESVNGGLDRATALVVELEKNYDHKDILLVSHGDTLQILQTGFQKIDPAKHRSLSHLETGKIRQMILAS